MEERMESDMNRLHHTFFIFIDIFLIYMYVPYCTYYRRNIVVFKYGVRMLYRNDFIFDTTP